MDDVDSPCEDLATETPRGDDVDLARGPEVDDPESGLGRANAHRLVGASRHGAIDSTTRQFAREPKRLALAAAPSAFRVDVQHSHRTNLLDLARA
jgi:hypothetical protein